MDQIKNHAKILAEAMPPLSGPAGWYEIIRIPFANKFDINLSDFKDATLWPTSREGKSSNQETYQRWLHGDYKDAPYLLTYRFYDKLSELAN
jgi:hypothetical protein